MFRCCKALRQDCYRQEVLQVLPRLLSCCCCCVDVVVVLLVWLGFSCCCLVLVSLFGVVVGVVAVCGGGFGCSVDVWVGGGNVGCVYMCIYKLLLYASSSYI